MKRRTRIDGSKLPRTRPDGSKMHSRAGGRGKRPNSRQKRRNRVRAENEERRQAHLRFLDRAIAQGEQLLEQVTAEDAEAQRRSFAFGNASIDNPLVTRELVDQAAEKS